MPKGIIKTPSQEKKWEKAKDIAAKQGKAKRWPLIMAIFRQMGGMSKADQDHQNVLVERALAAQGKKTTIPQEAHEALHAWWQSNKETALSPKQVLSDIKNVKDRRSKMPLVKSSSHLDEMILALNALKSEIDEKLFKAKYSVDWEQHPGHSPEELKRIQKLVDEGYHPREAAHLISPATGGRGEPKDFMRALASRVAPTDLSPNMLQHARSVAQQWLDQYQQHVASRARPEINPVIHASSAVKAAHEAKTADYHKAYTDFLSSDELKGKSPIDRHKAVQAWKTKWKQENPEHEGALSGVSEVGSKFKEAEQARKKHIEEVKHHLVHGGAPVESETAESEVEHAAPMSARAISEHMGIGGEEEDAPKISAKMDPSMKFATQHKKFVEEVLRPQVPHKPVTAAPPPEAQPKAPEKPKTVIRRVAKPDQLERMQNVDAAKMALKTKKE